ncbi:DsrE family protein [Chitinophaga nivalis]|uniref:DsrE family protein n=1 Tax=Chitinophaga nivalis TaxID=2991709 RepID=A0ABT3IVP1_9BACT|nr:DsrE family protein [Chitinophaga nivalis]MCW3462251.1 DsrE family protein [Chitinophaga nivalis]MCW3488057.1 DsrE family protein [Chitinophaga nivalis]
MKKTLLLLCCCCILAAHQAISQQKTKYKAVYQLNSDDDKIIRGTLRNIKNALEDPRLQQKITIELVAHGGGVTVFKKDHPYEELLQDLKARGVILVECENTLKERNIKKEELFPFISYTPSGNGELIIRQQEGWSYVHP